MIVFTRLNRNLVALNPDLIERVEANPDTVITMVDDKRVLVLEPLDEVVRVITDYRAYVIKRSRELELVASPRPSLQLVPDELMASNRDTLDRIGAGEAIEGLDTADDGAPNPTTPHTTTPRSTTR